LDVLAQLYRTGTDSVQEYSDTLSRTGSLSREMGLNFQQFAGFLSVVTEVTARSGPSLAAMMQQMNQIPFSAAGQARLGRAGIMTEGKQPLEVWREAAQRFTSYEQDDPRRREILLGMGGPRYQAEAAAMLTAWANDVEPAMSGAGKAVGAMTDAMNTLGNTTAAAKERVLAAWENMLTDIVQATQADRTAVYLMEGVSQGLSAITFSEQWFRISREQRREIAQSYEQETGQSMFRGGMAEAMGLKNGMPREMALFNSYLFNTPNDETARQMREYVLAYQQRGQRGTAATTVPETPLVSLNLLRNQTYSANEERRFLDSVGNWDTFLADQGRMVEMTQQQYIVQTESGLVIKDIQASAEAISLATAEMNERGKRLEGVWNLPGPAYAPLSSLFPDAGQTKYSAAHQPQGYVPYEVRYQEDLARQVEERRQAQAGIPTIAEQMGQPSRRRLEIAEQVARDSAATATPAVVAPAPERSAEWKRTLIGPLGEWLQQLWQRERSISLQVPVNLDGQKVADVVGSVQGEQLQRNIRSGGDFGSTLAPSVGGVI
jgi:hypothetical protein